MSGNSEQKQCMLSPAMATKATSDKKVGNYDNDYVLLLTECYRMDPFPIFTAKIYISALLTRSNAVF